MKTVFNILICLIGFATITFAESVDELLQQLTVQQQSIGELRMDFTHTRESDLFLEPQIRSGIFYYGKDKGICMFYKTPDTYVVLLKGKRTYLIQPDRPMQEHELSSNPFFAGMARMMTFDLSNMPRFFYVQLTDNNSSTQLALTPKKQADIDNITLILNRDTAVIQSMDIHESSGDQQQMRFEPPIYQTIDPEYFTTTYWKEVLQTTP